MAKMANLITAPSNAMKQWAVKNWAFKEAQIIVIPNPVPTAELFLKIPIENSVQHKKILFFGRLNTLKGMVALTKAMAKILVEFKDWTFEVVGDDGPGVEAGSSMKNWMQKKLDKVKGQIVFSEGIPYDQLGIKLNEASFVVLPSLFESFSYTCAEAMAAGRAVIGSERGGMVDLLDNGKCGILINPESERDIYNAIKQLILNATLRVQLGSVARQWLKSEHDIHKTIHQFMDVYSKGLKLY
jgi:glycosyltransferase involved in cell wall biosynthesis